MGQIVFSLLLLQQVVGQVGLQVPLALTVVQAVGGKVEPLLVAMEPLVKVMMVAMQITI